MARYPEFSEARYYYGLALINTASLSMELTRDEKNKTVYKAIEELSKIPKESQLYSNALYVKQVYEAYLAKEEAMKSNQ